MENKYIEDLLKSLDHRYYAHTKETSDFKEPLVSHLKLTYEYYKRMEKDKKLDVIIKNIIKSAFNVDNNMVERIYDLFKQAIYYHDIGKINPLFQKNKMGNDLGVKVDNQDDTHAALSARIFVDSYIGNFENEKTNDSLLLLYVSYFFGYIISRHHTKLTEFSDFIDSIKYKNIPEIPEAQTEKYENYLDVNIIEKLISEYNIQPIELYILCKVLYSSIITADFYATYEYMSDKKVDFEIKRNDKLFEKYEKSDLIKTIRDYENKKIKIDGINKLRNDIFIESERNIKDNLEKNIFYLEAPTGAGKTNIAINLARTLYENNKEITSIHYIFPFNNIIEQTDNTFKNYFAKYSDYTVINSLSAMTDDLNENLNYNEIYVKTAFNQYPIVITSHVNLFNTLFGTGKEKNYGLFNYINSIVILDEIQAYSNGIWKQMIEMFDKYAKLLNIKFIIMSATLPRLDKLLDNTMASFYSLVNDTKRYYENRLFKNRVKLDYSLLNENGEKINFDELVSEIYKYKDRKLLVECITKKTAEKLYHCLKDLDTNVYIMTGDDNKYYRNNIIEKTKNEDNIILVATQTIEAGVDIDMDIGFKDITFIDGEEQFIGRVNRSSKKDNCITFFFDLDPSQIVYRNDKRLGYSVKKEKNRKLLENKNFEQFYNCIMKNLSEDAESYTEDNFNNFKDACVKLDFKKVEEKLVLISNELENIDIFINYTINKEGKTICGKDVFEEYKTIFRDNNLSYAEKKVKLSQISEDMNLFTYSINSKDLERLTYLEAEKDCGFYYIDNGEDYIEDGRFNRSKLLEKGDDLFL